jgi:hypothetical protein
LRGGFLPPCGASAPAPREKPPVGAGLAPNGFGAGTVGAVAAEPPKGLALADAPPNGAAAPPNAGVELALPNGFATPADAPPNGFAPPPPNGFVDGALLVRGAAKLVVDVPPNREVPLDAAPRGDLLDSNGLIGSGVFGCSSGFGG